MHRYKRLVLTVTLVAGGWFLTAIDVLAEEKWDACTLLQQADVEVAFAPRKFVPGPPERAVVKPSAKLAAVSKCTFTSSGATAKDRITVSLVARRAPSDASGVRPQAAMAAARQLKATPLEVAGLGEGAYTVNLGSAAFPVLELNVFRGKRDWLVFGCAGIKLDSKVALAGLIKVANASAARQ
jgi:hypothetical protein